MNKPVCPKCNSECFRGVFHYVCKTCCYLAPLPKWESGWIEAPSLKKYNGFSNGHANDAYSFKTDLDIGKVEETVWLTCPSCAATSEIEERFAHGPAFCRQCEFKGDCEEFKKPLNWDYTVLYARIAAMREKA